ncbi:MAG: JAB domain-containing protein [Fusobacteriaceae bacterium]
MIKNVENLNSGHRERLREKYLNSGIDGFHHGYEQLEFLLTFVFRQRDVKPLAKELLKKFQTLEGVLRADINELKSVKGVGENTAIFLKFLGDFHGVIFHENNKGQKQERETITSKKELISYLKNRIGFRDRENFFVLFLNSANQVIDTPDLRSGTVFEGTLDRSAVYAREIVKKITEQHRVIEESTEKTLSVKYEENGELKEITARNIIEKAFKNKAKSVILAHNHPSNNIRPSKSDIEVTRGMREALNQVEIKLLDHIIIGKDSHFSFLEEGLIEY